MAEQQTYYNDIHLGFQVSRADNGYIFKEYDVTTDSFKIKLAMNDDELAALIEDWSGRIALSIRKGAMRKAKPDG